jgi:hypothetical protein
VIQRLEEALDTNNRVFQMTNSLSNTTQVEPRSQELADLRKLHQHMFETQERIIQENIQQRKALEEVTTNLRNRLNVLEQAQVRDTQSQQQIFETYQQQLQWSQQRVVDYASINACRGGEKEHNVLGAPPQQWMLDLQPAVSRYALLITIFGNWLQFMLKRADIVDLNLHLIKKSNVSRQDMEVWTHILHNVSNGPKTAQDKMVLYDDLIPAEITDINSRIDNKIKELVKEIVKNLLQCRSILPYITLTDDQKKGVPKASDDFGVDAAAHELASKIMLAGTTDLKNWGIESSDNLVQNWLNGDDAINIIELDNPATAKKNLQGAVRTLLEANLNMIATARWDKVQTWAKNSDTNDTKKKAYNIIIRRWIKEQGKQKCTDLLSNVEACSCFLYSDLKTLN